MYRSNWKTLLCSLILLGSTTSLARADGKDIVLTAVEAGSFKTLVAAVQAADLVEALKSEGPFTVFAPTDEAFAALPKGTVENLLKPENKQQLVDILKYHVVAGEVRAKQVVSLSKAKTLDGRDVGIRVKDGAVLVNDSKVIKTDISCSNGVIHVIDAVLLPPRQSVSARDAQHMIENAVARGVHLYNRGHHEACARLYTAALEKMVAYGDQMPPLVMTDLKDTLSHASATQCSTSRAWALRRCIDRTYVAMRKLNHVQE